MQADAYSGFNALYEPDREPRPLVEAGCWAHFRRKFFELARLQKAPIAIEAVRRIDELFAIEREINGRPIEQRLAVRRERSKPLAGKFEDWMRLEGKRLSPKHPLVKAMNYGLTRWEAFVRFLNDGRICMTNNDQHAAAVQRDWPLLSKPMTSAQFLGILDAAEAVRSARR